MPESRLSVGNVEIVGLTDIDVEFPMPLTQLFPNVPLAAWAPHQQRYPEAFPRPDTWRPHFGGFLLRSQGRTILVDTGMGSTVTNPGAVAMFTGGADGHLLEELQALGVRPEDIDTVFLTHLHPDHVGWNLRPGGPAQATFPPGRAISRTRLTGRHSRRQRCRKASRSRSGRRPLVPWRPWVSWNSWRANRR
jgi:glyoxylase-like metal-dependent hydrolase (beta-lactamase superfamily II)